MTEVWHAKQGRRTGGTNVAVHSSEPKWGLIALSVAIHVPLAVIMSHSPLVSTLHALVTLAIGLIIASSSKSWVRCLCVVAYIAGSEVLWRMTNAKVVWEFGKYALVLILLVAGMRHNRFNRSALAAAYFALLIPAALMTFLDFPLNVARQMVSYNLSGPLCIAICLASIPGTKFTRSDLLRLQIAFLSPVIGMAALILFHMSGVDLTFGDHSNSQTSGGFGPNQVSAVLGFACLFSFYAAVNTSFKKVTRVVAAAVSLWMGLQSMLTFSRCGIYYAVGSLALVCAVLMRSARARWNLMFAVIALGSIAHLALLPWLDDYTGGQLSQRMTDTNLTGRGELAKLDLMIMAQHPILGIGVGMSDLARADYLSGSLIHSHTEFSRLLADHGLLGLVALCIFCGLVAKSLLRAKNPQALGFSLGLAAFACAFMLGNGVRLAFPCFIIGLSGAIPFTQSRLRWTRPTRTRSGGLSPNTNIESQYGMPSTFTAK